MDAFSLIEFLPSLDSVLELLSSTKSFSEVSVVYEADLFALCC